MCLVGCHGWINKPEWFQVKTCQEAEGGALHCQLLPSEWGWPSPVSLREHNPGGAAQGRLTLGPKVRCKDLEMLEAFAGESKSSGKCIFTWSFAMFFFFLANFLCAEIWPNVCRNQIQGNASTEMNNSSKGREQDFPDSIQEQCVKASVTAQVSACFLTVNVVRITSRYWVTGHLIAGPYCFQGKTESRDTWSPFQMPRLTALSCLPALNCASALSHRLMGTMAGIFFFKTRAKLKSPWMNKLINLFYCSTQSSIKCQR